MWLQLSKLFRYGIVGCSGLVIDYAITYICKEKLRFNKYLANIMGFTIAVVNNYIWNRLWTFQSVNQHITTEFGSFLVISIIGLILNTTFLYFLHEKKKANFYLSKAFVILLVLLWNFSANSLITFHRA